MRIYIDTETAEVGFASNLVIIDATEEEMEFLTEGSDDEIKYFAQYFSDRAE